MPEIAQIKQKRLIMLVLIIEILLFLFALIWSYIAKINPFFSIYYNFADIIFALAAGIIFLIINFLAINVLSGFIPFFKSLKKSYQEISAIAVNITIPGALVIAVISGFVEEIFFRGILQQQFGIIIASIVFGIFHISNIKMLSYSIYTVFVGFYMGLLFLVSGNLLVPILVHIINNFIALPYMKYHYKKYVREEHPS